MRFGRTAEAGSDSVLRTIRRLVDSFDLRDLHIYGGLALIGYGGWLVHPAAGLMPVGLALFYIGWRLSA